MITRMPREALLWEKSHPILIKIVGIILMEKVYHGMQVGFYQRISDIFSLHLVYACDII
jgi:hypothetical protein